MDDKSSLWWLYIIECADDSLYTGITKDVEKRFTEHSTGGPKSAKYLRGRGPLKLVFQQAIGSHSDALKEEYRIKQLTKPEKISLIKQGM